MVSKGRTPPPATIDHARNLRERVGKAAYTQWRNETGQLPSWEQLSADERVAWQMIGQAVMDVIVVKDDRQGDFSVSSIYGYKNQKPYVNVEVSVSPMQMSPAKAREIALMLLECADAAESDAALIAFARDTIGLDDTRAGQLLSQFRQLREQRRGTEVDSA